MNFRAFLSVTLLGLSLLSFSSLAQGVYVSPTYKVDRDGDGVPDVRDQCPDTDKNLNGHEFTVAHEGQEYAVKITDFKGTLETHRRKLRVDLSRLRRKRKEMQESFEGKGKKPQALNDEQKKQLADMDTLIEAKRGKLTDLVYVSSITVNQEVIPVEIPLGVDEFGCLPDRDGDEVPDIVDKCPDEPGLRYYQGCNDRDGDQVIDPLDKCIDEPGLVKLQGCPEEGTGDRDKDGVIDRDDLCPDTFGSKRNKGCPEIVTSQERGILDRASKVLFDSGKASLRPESYSILNELASLIKSKAQQYKSLRVRLEGHTDTDGLDQSNLILSRNRSRSVKNYLVSQGVDISMISTAGYGEGRLLISPERNPADKQANRRVEIAITSQ